MLGFWQKKVAFPIANAAIVAHDTQRFMQAQHQYRRAAVGEGVVMGDTHF
jgi:hypothetical protein